MAKRSLGAEWFGYDGGEFTPPKSFGMDDDPSWVNAYRGLFFLVGGIDSSKNVDVTEPTEVCRTSACFLEFILIKNILSLAKKLSSRHRPTYQQKSEALSKIRGRINFHKTATKCLGDQTRFVCEYHELNQNDPLSILLKNGARLINQHLGRWLNEENKRILSNSVKAIDGALSATKETSNLHPICFRFLSGHLKNHKFEDVYPEASLIAYFLLYSQIGYVGADSENLQVSGIMLNLNRTFEKLMTEALIATGKFKKDKEQLNQVYLVSASGKQKSSFTMKPDCKGYLEISGKTFYVLMDAKHKLMSGDLPDTDEKRERLDECINRADLYQMITYLQTMSGRKEAVHGTLAVLVGLNYEVGTETDLISIVPAVEVNYDDQTSEVLRICMNFGLAMKMLGEVLSDSTARQDVMKKLGEQVLSAVALAGKVDKAA